MRFNKVKQLFRKSIFVFSKKVEREFNDYIEGLSVIGYSAKAVNILPEHNSPSVLWKEIPFRLNIPEGNFSHEQVAETLVRAIADDINETSIDRFKDKKNLIFFIPEKEFSAKNGQQEKIRIDIVTEQFALRLKAVLSGSEGSSYCAQGKIDWIYDFVGEKSDG